MSLTEMFKGKSKGEEGRKATEILKQDHAKVKELFAEYRALEDEDDTNDTNDMKEKARLFEEIRRELTVHATVEEEIFYPAVKRVPDEDASHVVAEATEEHAIVKTLLADLGNLEPGEEVFEAKMKVLMEAVEHHAEEEEDEMFDEADKLEEDRLRELGGQIEKRKEQLLAGGLATKQAPRRAASTPARQHARASSKARSSSKSRKS